MEYLRVLKNSVLTKFVTILLVIGLIPILLFGVISYKVATNALSDYELAIRKDQQEFQERLVTLSLRGIESLIENISGVEEITDALRVNTENVNRFQYLATSARIGYILNGYLNIDGLLAIDIITEFGSHYHIGDTLVTEALNTPLFEKLKRENLASGESLYWHGVTEAINLTSTHNQVVTASKILFYMDRESLRRLPLAIIVVSYELKEFSKILANSQGSDGKFFLVDQNNNIIYSNVAVDAGSKVADLGITDIEESSGEIVLDNKKYLIQVNELDQLGWHTINLTPVDVLSSKISRIRNTSIVLILIAILLISVTSHYIYHMTIQPIRQIADGFIRLGKNQYDFTQPLEVRSDDEIGDLTGWYNSYLQILRERTQSEQELRDSEERYRLIMSASKEGLWDWNLITDQLLISDNSRNILGIQKKSENNDHLIEPKEWFERVNEDDIEILITKTNQLKMGVSSNLNHEYRLADGDKERWVLTYGMVVRNADGEAIRMAGSHSDITRRKQTEAKLYFDAFHDSLTGLYNRAWLQDYLTNLLKQQHRNRVEYFTLLFLDLDRFKMVNDLLGHDVGDDLLIEVTKRLKSCVREADVIARLGGDEFVIILMDCEGYRLLDVAKRIVELIHQPFEINHQKIQTGASIGITQSNSGYDSQEAMLRDADIAMYQAKAQTQGKGSFVIFDDEMRQQLMTHSKLESDLKTALLTEDQLFLCYQPIYDLQSNQCIGAECLVRWEHPENGMIPPDKFIPIAETTNLIFSLGRRIIDRSLYEWSEFTKKLNTTTDLHLSINISAKQFQDENLIPFLIEKTALYNLNQESIAIEITETALIENYTLAKEFIDELGKQGFSIHLDDFGTGYSSLSHLVNFDIDVVKIDREFISGTQNLEKGQKIVNSIIHLAQELNLECTAEGVENESHLQFLVNVNCKYAQGYLLGRPVRIADFNQFITSAP